ncbi:uncharacterized protein TM35_000221540 [Trypanosoma theileri]|uniref:Uncharacterized protein n=1 Tax=Trypanosoma theileri TaxID=67003 RepID=A0A1X0NRM5_9TRYP|nr:uncharacterized protein TM35_000221540 [Trypanosoma theileri]ORC87355.1 hypothetical protein TM35_000221540 [Trypanosoma theileri]
MSRADKQHHRDHVVGTAGDASVRVYAFANSRPAYRVVFAPEEPLIVLKTRASAGGPQHPCAQWAPFAAVVFRCRPNTTAAVYVVDTTQLPEAAMREENTVGGHPIHQQTNHNNGGDVNSSNSSKNVNCVGPVVRRVANTIARLNPHNATMIAAGVSAPIALKYAIAGEKRHGHSDRLVRRLLLVCPPSLDALKQLVRPDISSTTTTTADSQSYPKLQLMVMLSDTSQLQRWKDWLQETANTTSWLDSWSISTNLQPSLFEAVAREVGITADGTEVNLQTHYKTPRVFRIDFVLSKATKKTEQYVTLSPLTTTGCDENDDDDDENDEYEDNDTESHSDVEKEDHEGETTRRKCKGDHDGESCCDSHESHEDEVGETVFGLTTLQHCSHPTNVIVEGRLMDTEGTILGTTEGRVIIHGLHEAIKMNDTTMGKQKITKGVALHVESRLNRDDSGSTTLEVLKVTPLTKMQERRSMTICPMKEVPLYNVSSIAHAYGALLIRGRKCVLVRSLDGEFDGMRLPFLMHSDAEESCMQCAVRALCERCDISPDNFYIPNFFSPVCYYDKNGPDGKVLCVTIYIALAVSPPSGGAPDTVEDDENPGEPYDWFGFNKAMSVLQTEAEREVLVDLQRGVRRAYDATLYIPLKGFGVFGETVMDVGGPSTALPSLEGLEMMVVCAPGDVKGETMRLVREYITDRVVSVNESTSRVEIERAAVETMRDGARMLVLCLSPDVDVSLFSEEELTYWSEREARPRLVTLLFPDVSEMIVRENHPTAVAARAAFVYAVMLSDVLVTVDHRVENFSPSLWGVLRLASSLNADLALHAGVMARRSIEFPQEEEISNEATLREISVRRVGCPIVASRLALLLKEGGMQLLGCRNFQEEKEEENSTQTQCDGVLLWAEGEVWLASRPHARGVLTLDIHSHCLTLEEGDLWESEEENESTRANEITLHVWATATTHAVLESTVAAALDDMMYTTMPSKVEAVRDDKLPQWN